LSKIKIAISVAGVTLERLAEVLEWRTGQVRNDILQDNQEVETVYLSGVSALRLPLRIQSAIDKLEEVVNVYKDKWDNHLFDDEIKAFKQRAVLKFIAMSVYALDEENLIFLEDLSALDYNSYKEYNLEEIEAEMKEKLKDRDRNTGLVQQRQKELLDVLSRKVAPEFDHVSSQLKSSEINLRSDINDVKELIKSMDKKLDRKLKKKSKSKKRKKK